MPPKEKDSWQPLEEAQAAMAGEPMLMPPGQTIWANDLYVVIKAPLPGPPDAGWHLSIRRQDRSTARDWRHFQRIKNQLCGAEWEAMEIYPAESRLVDTSNQYHLWCVPQHIPVGFPGRLVLEDPQDAPGAVQRPFEAIDLAYGGVTQRAEYEALLTQAAEANVRGARRMARAAERTAARSRPGHRERPAPEPAGE